ncbi:GL22410 [Drosophila persimilis]|uniref:GL22410 n=1 Tax=Drosophila persimilis TaxID=7234 RepID=B4HD52_DROPE|nr:GL22410 [Drosophila persimilis]
METKRLTHEDGKKKMEDLRAFLEEQQAIVREGGYRADASRQRRASLLSRGDEEDWCDGSQFLQLLASPLVSPAPSGHDSVSPTVSSDEGAGESEDEVICTDGPRAPTAQEKARWRRQQRTEPETRTRRPLTLRDRIEAVKRRFQEATPEEKRRIHRVLEAARTIRRRRDERLEARRRQAGRAASKEEPGQESDEAPPLPPFRVVLPPMQSRTDEAETEGAQPQAMGERATNSETEWQRLSAAGSKEGGRRVALRALITDCEAKDTGLIVGCDANAHHCQWGSTDTNERGEYLFNYLLTTQMVLLNRGSDPTFIIKNRKEVLDLTLASHELHGNIVFWRALEEHFCSDHSDIENNSEASRLRKVLSKTTPTMGYLKDADQSWTTSSNESLNLLLNIHYPAALKTDHSTSRLMPLPQVIS